MTRDDFIRIRKRQGKLAALRSVKPCPTCGGHVQRIITRKEPKKMFFVFEPGPGGQLHECPIFHEAANAG